MARLPKIKLKMPNGREEIRDLEEAKNFLSNWGMLIIVEGQAINSYEQLIKIANQNSHKSKEFLEVTVVPFIEGG